MPETSAGVQVKDLQDQVATDIRRVCPVCGRNLHCLVVREMVMGRHDVMTDAPRTVCVDCRRKEIQAIEVAKGTEKR